MSTLEAIKEPLQADVDLQRLAHAIRFVSIDAIVRATEGHQGVPLGMAEIATALFTRHLKFNPADPTWPDRDRFVLSNGHGSMLLFSLLYLTGYEQISLDQIKTFRELGSHCEGHPEFDPASGIEVTTGPLGQGIANAFGMAVAEAYLNARFGDGLVDHYTYAFVGDGCLQEGIGQEMISLAGHLRLGKLILFWDDNRITDDGSTTLSISEDVAARFRVADWHVVEVDGHDLEAVSDAIAAAKKDPRPSMIACRTVIAKGIARLQGQRGGHSGRLHPEDAARGPAGAGLAASVVRGPRGGTQCVACCRTTQRSRTRRVGQARVCTAGCRARRVRARAARRAACRLARGAARLQAARRERGQAAGRDHDLRRDQRPADRRAAGAHGGAAPTSRRRPATSAGCRRSRRTTAAAPTSTAACAST